MPGSDGNCNRYQALGRPNPWRFSLAKHYYCYCYCCSGRLNKCSTEPATSKLNKKKRNWSFSAPLVVCQLPLAFLSFNSSFVRDSQFLWTQRWARGLPFSLISSLVVSSFLFQGQNQRPDTLEAADQQQQQQLLPGLLAEVPTLVAVFFF